MQVLIICYVKNKRVSDQRVALPIVSKFNWKFKRQVYVYLYTKMLVFPSCNILENMGCLKSKFFGSTHEDDDEEPQPIGKKEYSWYEQFYFLYYFILFQVFILV